MQLRDGGFMPTFIALPQARPGGTDVLLGEVFSRFNTLSARQVAGRHGAGEVA